MHAYIVHVYGVLTTCVHLKTLALYMGQDSIMEKQKLASWRHSLGEGEEARSSW